MTPVRETTVWLLNLLAILAVLVLLGIHMGIMHLDGVVALAGGVSREPLAWSEVARRSGDWLFAAGYVVLLGAALVHGLYGLHTIMTEIWTGRRAGVLLAGAFVIAGTFVFALGTFTAIAFGILQPGDAG